MNYTIFIKAEMGNKPTLIFTRFTIIEVLRSEADLLSYPGNLHPGIEGIQQTRIDKTREIPS
jgi:hypothetical protein